jgi:tetratricopeptide (TPR) repeat protein
MTRKVLIIAVVLWLAALAGGAFWGVIEKAWRRHVSPGEAEVQKLQALYGAREYDEVLAECDRAEKDPRFADNLPQILYIRWAAFLRTGKPEESRLAGEQILKRFPDHVLAADIHFNEAMRLLADGNYAEADRKLAMIQTKFPSAASMKKVTDIRQRLRNMATTAPVQPSMVTTRPEGFSVK